LPYRLRIAIGGKMARNQERVFVCRRVRSQSRLLLGEFQLQVHQLARVEKRKNLGKIKCLCEELHLLEHEKDYLHWQHQAGLRLGLCERHLMPHLHLHHCKCDHQRDCQSCRHPRQSCDQTANSRLLVCYYQPPLSRHQRLKTKKSLRHKLPPFQGPSHRLRQVRSVQHSSIS
jgi:hypothetical protein